MIYNYTKCESVIAKIMADLDSSEVRLRASDIREWIFEAVDKIGAPTLYVAKESGEDGVPILEIHDYQIPIPEDLQVLDGVAYAPTPHGPWKPMRTDTAVFKHRPHHGHCHHPAPLIPHLTTALSLFYTINTMKYLNRMFGEGFEDGRDLQYFIKPGWIVTNRKHGFVKLAYKAIATDERGYPLIPDLTSYQEAVYWYVVMKLTFPKWLGGKLGGSSKYAQKYAANAYTYVLLQWNFYRNLAYAEAMMPTADDMQNIKNDWNKLIPDWDGDDTFFRNIGQEQITYNDYHVH